MAESPREFIPPTVTPASSTIKLPNAQHIAGETRNHPSTVRDIVKSLLYRITPTRTPAVKKEDKKDFKPTETMDAQTQAPLQFTYIQSKGIYHGLPVIAGPDSPKGLTAIVTGANGMSGSHMVRVLAESPERWANIYAMSRRAAVEDGKYGNVTHLELDFLETSPEDLAKAMVENGVKADYIFYYSYIQGLCNVNGALLSNFLKALKLASITPKRFMLQTGAKNYGSHLGSSKSPQVESDPRVTLEPNFYYDQEDLLFQFCKETGVEWNVVRPSFMLGAARDAAMNLAYSLGVFAAVHAHLGEPLIFPGNIASFDVIRDLSSSKLTSYLAEWAVLNPDARNEAFNACDCSAVTPGALWTALAKIYRTGYKAPDPNAEYQCFIFPFDPPPRGFGPPEKMEFRYSFAAWSYDPKVHAAWQELSQKHGIAYNPFSSPADRNRIFGLTDAAILPGIPVQFSMDKSRKFGWHGTVDSLASLRSVLEELIEMKMLPPLPSTA
ncbi:predicted protein [Histoplasma mississippiense (nom. inval.)]|uniref:predicted protein n=1 Tax=Ajellomyces capsulatus (strain NAm1 / WU24) TaxID=2059318 RepID=UPI000157C3C8|nr:predicted protein [Histoplasma mississippiense (nom. inval.)]EDN07949.1 predicted protein [Histoplasma mississippiense (nom. inval.)]